MNDSAIRSVAIVGGGVAGWLAAAALARSFGREMRITVLEPHSDECDALLLGARPDVHALHAQLGVEEAQLVPAVRASFNLGTGMRGWKANSAYFLPFGEVGARLESVAFHQHLHRLGSLGRHFDAADFSIAALAARAARFAHPPDDPRSVFNTLQYGLHLDPVLYAALWRALALKGGATALPAAVRDVTLRGHDGFIEALVLDDGSRLAADLYIDCSGPRARLLGEALGVSFESWAQWLPCDRALVAHAAADGGAAPASSANAESAGWVWRVPLQHRVDQAAVYSSGECTEAQAAAWLTVSSAAAPRRLSFNNGRRTQAWSRNCVALGSAAGFLEPLASPGLTLLHAGVARLLALFPHRDNGGRLALEYDRLMRGEQERARDLLALHYFAAGRIQSLPDPLRYKLELFQSRGRIVVYDEELYSEAEWVSAFLGLGFESERHDALADQADLDQVSGMFERMRTLMARAVQPLPPHMQYASRFGRSPA